MLVKTYLFVPIYLFGVMSISQMLINPRLWVKTSELLLIYVLYVERNLKGILGGTPIFYQYFTRYL